MITLCELSSLPAKEDVDAGREGFDTYRQEYLDFVKKIRHNQQLNDSLIPNWIKDSKARAQVTKDKIQS